MVDKKVAIITGAGRGLGEAVAKDLLGKGISVASEVKKFAEKTNLTTISPRLPDGPTTPNQGTTMD